MQKTFLLIVILLCELAIGKTTYSQQSRGTVNSNGLKIAYESFGSSQSETILLIHGTGAQLTAWPRTLCEQMAKAGYQVIRFDNRDVGLSTFLDSLGSPNWGVILPQIGHCHSENLPYNLLDMAKDAIGLLDALNIEKAHIVGASMGGAIAQLIAINFPEKTLSLSSIMASTGNPKLPPGNPKVLQAMGAPPPETTDMEERANYMYSIYKALESPAYPTADSTLRKMAGNEVERSWNPEGVARQAAAILIADNCDRRLFLRKLQMPVTIIHGEADPLVNIAAAKELAATIPHARLITFPGMGHNLPDVLISEICNGILYNIKSTRQE